MSHSPFNDDHSWFKQLFELSPDPTWIIDDNRFVECNEAAIRTLGYTSREELLNVHPSKLSPPRQPDGEDSYAKAERMMSLAKDKGLHRFEWMHAKADGTNFVAEVTLSAIELRDRQVIYCVWRDITERKQAEEELRRFRLAMDATADGIYVVDRASMRFVDVNAGACNMLGLKREEILALGPEGVLSMSRENLVRLYDSVIASGGVTATAEILRTRKDGTQAWVEIQRRAQRAGEGWIIVTVARDVTKRKQAENALHKSEQGYRTMIDSAPEGVWMLDPGRRTSEVNQRMCDLLGYTREDMLGRAPVEFADAENGKMFQQQARRVPSRETRTYEVALRHRDGRNIPTEFNATNLFNEDGSSMGVLAFVVDLTERRRMEDQVRQMAFHDTLTNLPNRRLLNDRLSQAVAANKRSGCYGTVMFLDLDNFKSLNDAYGHAVGDLLLIEAADRLKSCVREMDTVGRFGGDEFVVMISELDVDRSESAAEAGFIAEKIRAALAKPYVLQVEHEGAAKTTVEHHCTASIGVALFGKHEASEEDILKRADAAMYQAKEAGCNLIRFYDSKY